LYWNIINELKNTIQVVVPFPIPWRTQRII
jgi:hypothetical protein